MSVKAFSGRANWVGKALPVLVALSLGLGPLLPLEVNKPRGPACFRSCEQLPVCDFPATTDYMLKLCIQTNLPSPKLLLTGEI